MLFLIRGVDWLFTLLLLAGVIVCAFTSWDANRDLHVRRRVGVNGNLLLAGRIARRSALASMGLHVGFLVIGSLALLSPLPPPDRWVRSVLTAIIFVTVQLLVVTAQLRSQLDRSALRRRALTEAR